VAKFGSLKGGELEMMTKERKGEIAYRLWKYRLKKEGIRLDELDREIGNISKSTGIPREELREFVQEITGELVKEAFESKK